MTRPSVPVEDRSVAVVMSKPVLVVRATATLPEALALLAAAKVRHLVVLTEEARYHGVLVDRVVASEWARGPVGFERRTVGQVADTGTPSVPPTATVAEIARAMHRCETDAVVVVEVTGQPVGIVTATDLIGLLADAS